MYGVDNDNDDTLKNSKTPEGYGFLRNYVTHTQIIHHALTGEGLNVYIENNKSILLANTSEQGEKAFKAAIDWYKKNGAEKYKIWSESYILQAEDFVQRFKTSINNPYIVRQLEMMTISGLTRPFGAENWDFIMDYIEGLKQK